MNRVCLLLKEVCADANFKGPRRASETNWGQSVIQQRGASQIGAGFPDAGPCLKSTAAYLND